MNVEIENMLKQRFEYDPERGLIERGTGALCRVKHIRFDGLRLRIKNIAWWLHTGEWSDVVRTLDGDYTNLRISNLVNTLKGEKATARKERIKEEEKEKARLAKAAKAAIPKPEPMVSLTFSEGVWHLKGPGVNADFKRFKSAMSALTDLYYTCAKLEDKPM